MFLKKLKKIVKRHPFLYLTRFRLLSKNSSAQEIKDLSYNDLNPKTSVPACFNEVNAVIFEEGRPNDDFETVMIISKWLKKHIKGGPGLSEPSEKALKTMLSGKGGVCSDMAQVFNNFCVINDIQVREWGTTTVPFNRLYGGHSFNEVFCKEFDKWILIDVYWGFMFYGSDNIPLSVIEFYTLKRKQMTYSFKPFISRGVELTTVERNYLSSGIAPFLICNYRNTVYDSFLKYTRPVVPVFMIHFFIYLINLSYHYRFPLDDYKKLFT